QLLCFFFSSRRRHTRWPRDWSSDVCSSDLSVGQLAVILCVPGPARTEVIEQTIGAVRVPELLEGREKELLSAGEVRVAGSDVIEIGRASCRERVWMWVVEGS